MASVSTELVSRVQSKSFVAAAKPRRGNSGFICDAVRNPRDPLINIDPDQCGANCSRRDGLLLSLGLVGAGLLNVSDSEARTDPYYDDLLSKTKLDSNDLLQKYKKINSSADSKKKGKNPAKKPTVNKNTGVLNKKKPSSSVKPAGAAAAGAGINPVEVGLGLAGVAGVVAIGQSSKKSDGGKVSKVPPRSAATTAVRKPPARSAPPKPAPKKTPPKPAPRKEASGTVRLSPGTRKIESKTKKIGTAVAKGSRATQKEQQSGSSSAPAILVAAVALLGGFTVLGSKPDVKSTQSVSNTPKAAEKVSVKPSAPEPSQQVAQAPPVSEAPRPAPIAKTPPVSQKPAEEVKKPKLPPTTGNSPLVIIGGSVAALIAAAAVGGGSEATSERNQSSTTASPTLDDSEARAKEAREWIEAWRKKNQKN